MLTQPCVDIMERLSALPANLTITLSATLAMAKARVQQLRRYPGWLLLDIILPIIFAALPILMGRALAGDAVAENFEMNTGSAEYVAYLIIGGNIFVLVTGAMWNIGFWVRREQQTGTLEALYLTPTSRAVMVAGVALYQAIRGLFTSTIAYLAGCGIVSYLALRRIRGTVRRSLGAAVCLLLAALVSYLVCPVVYWHGGVPRAELRLVVVDEQENPVPDAKLHVFREGQDVTHFFTGVGPSSGRLPVSDPTGRITCRLARCSQRLRRRSGVTSIVTQHHDRQGGRLHAKTLQPQIHGLKEKISAICVICVA